jgi:hypothetical protein
MGPAASWVGAGSIASAGVGVGVGVSVDGGAAGSVGVDVGVGTGVSVAVGVAVGVESAVTCGVTASVVEVGLGVAGDVGDVPVSSYVWPRDGCSPSGAVDQSPSSQMELGA